MGNQMQIDTAYAYTGFANELRLTAGYRLPGIDGLELKAGVAQIFQNNETGLDDETRIFAGLTYGFGGTAGNAYSSLFPAATGSSRSEMRLSDIKAVA